MLKVNGDIDWIRYLALHVLSEFPNGIRPTQLRAILESDLGEIYPPDDYKKGLATYRNATWDIDKRFPMFVKKTSVSSKHVILSPTEELFQAIREKQIPKIELMSKSQEESWLLGVRVEAVKSEIRRLNHYISGTGITRMTEIRDWNEISSIESAILVKLKLAISLLEECNDLVEKHDTRNFGESEQ